MKSFVASLVLLFLAANSVTQADLVQGDLLGVFSGNDSEASILAELGLDVTFLAKVETPDSSSGGLSINTRTPTLWE